jgi:hypothetical protein
MSYSAPLEMLADASGSVSFGWADEGVYYARFARSLSARLGEAFAARLRSALLATERIQYFGDARAVESYDLVARSAFVRVVAEHRSKFQQLNLLWWDGEDMGGACIASLGQPLYITRDVIDFESRLLEVAPRARSKLGAGPPEPRIRRRWPMRGWRSG